MHYATKFVKDTQDFKDQDLSFKFLCGLLEADSRPQNTGLARQKNRSQQSELPSGLTGQNTPFPSGSSQSFQVAGVRPHRTGRSVSYTMAAAYRAPSTLKNS